MPYIGDHPSLHIYWSAALAVRQERWSEAWNSTRALLNDEGFVSSLPPFARWYHKMFVIHKYQAPEDTPPFVPPIIPAYGRTVTLDDPVLAGCDHDGNTRKFEWNPDVNGLNDLQQRIAVIEKTKDGYRAEFSYLWNQFAKKEHNFYLMADGAAKDALRTELLVLHSIMEHLWLQLQVLNLDLADSAKLSTLLEKKFSGSEEPWAPAEDVKAEDKHFVPHLTTSILRYRWMSLRRLVYSLDGYAKLPRHPRLDDSLARANLTTDEKQDEVRSVLAAIDRLLKEFENQVEEAEAHNEKEASPNE